MKLGRYVVLIALAAAGVLALAPGSASAFGCLTQKTAPVAAFSFSPTTPAAGSAVSFDAGASQGGSHTTYTYNSQTQGCEEAGTFSDAISSYSWDFGDGGTATGATPSHTFAAGTYTVTLTVTAGTAGSDSTSHTVATSWVVTLTDPTSSTTVLDTHKHQSMTLAATASGPIAVNRVDFYVRGVKVATDNSAPYSASFDTTTIADGDAVVYARAVAADNSVYQTASRTVVIDNTLPAFTLLEQPAGPVQPWNATFRVRFTDAGLLYGNPYCWADSPTPVNGELCIGGGVMDTMEGYYTFASLPDGPHTVYFQAADAARNYRTGSATVTIDGTAPDTSITSGPADGSSSTDASPSFELASTETGSTFTCRLYPQGGGAPAFAPCSAASSHAASGLAPGTYLFEAVARDLAGNEDATPAGRTFTVTAPVTSAGGGGDSVGPSTQAGGGTPVTQTPQGGSGTPKSTAGKCAKLKGKKRATCVRRNCAKAKKKSAKKYRACVKSVTRKR